MNEKTIDSSPSAYKALALQVRCQAVDLAWDKKQIRTKMIESIDRIGRQIEASLAFIGKDCRLVVMPEYFLTGFPEGESLSSWSEKASLDMNGPEYEKLGGIAQHNNIFLSGNAYENDPHFPGLYFQTCFLLDPSGNMALRYRRLHSMYSPTPHDVWDKYLDCYGLEGVFPVAKTEIGNLAAIASEEILYPELARCLAMRGAEIFLHPASELKGQGETPKEAAKISRAVENMAYVVSTNTAGIFNRYLPAASADGGSKIIDYRGLILAEAGQGESMVAFSEINIAALRRYRRQPGMQNLLARQRFELYADSYDKFHFYPANNMSDDIPDRQHFNRIQDETIERLAELGII